MDECAKEFNRKNIIFVRNPNRKTGLILFKFDLTKECLKQFLISFTPSDFNEFVHGSIKNNIKTDPTSSVIRTREKYLGAPTSVGAFLFRQKIYVSHNTQKTDNVPALITLRRLMILK